MSNVNDSSARPVNGEKFRNNYDSIFRKKKVYNIKDFLRDRKRYLVSPEEFLRDKEEISRAIR